MNENQIPTPTTPSIETVPVQNQSINQQSNLAMNEVKPVITNTNVEIKQKEPIFMDKHSYGQFLKDIVKYITSKNSSELFALLWRLVLVAGFVIILSLPFLLIKDLIPDLLINIGVNFDDKGLNLINLIFRVLYLIFAIFIFFKLCKERYYRYLKDQEEIKKLSQQAQNE